jgi:hypothetical protein
MQENELAADDLIKGGVPAIAKHTGETVRRTYYMLERGLLPGFKNGDRWYMRKSRYLAMIEEREAEAAR